MRILLPNERVDEKAPHRFPDCVTDACRRVTGGDPIAAGTRLKPQRLQLSRKKGWRLPANTVVVARPTPWGNPYKVGDPGIPTAAEAVIRFRQRCTAPDSSLMRVLIRNELRGKNLACWCPLDQPCHADVLLKIANAGSL